MCFYIEQSNKSEKTASMDILCFKIVSADCSNWHGNLFDNHIKYDRYKLYHAKYYDGTRLSNLSVTSEYPDDTRKIINEGIHSYSVNNKNGCSHLYTSVGLNFRFIKKVLFFVIPKGSKYYYNSERYEYVSVNVKRISKKKFKELLLINKGKRLYDIAFKN